MEATKKLIDEIHKNKEEIIRDGYHQSIMNIMYKHWQKEDINMSYDEITEWFKNEYGELVQFAVLIGKYNQQVTNGGHFQYYSNGYAGDIDKYNLNIPLHKTLVTLLYKTKLTDEISLKVLKILEEFYIELDEDEYIEEEIFEDGQTIIDEYDNPDYMEVINTEMLNRFDLEYYKINDKFIKILEQYFKNKIETINYTWDNKDDYYYVHIDELEINLHIYTDGTISLWLYNHNKDTELLDEEYKDIDDIKSVLKNVLDSNIDIDRLMNLKIITGETK